MNESVNQLNLFLDQIQSGLPFGSVVFIFIFFSFKSAQLLWRAEQKSDSENIEKIKEISGQFRTQFIEPILINNTKKWVDEAYEEAIEYILSKFCTKINVSEYSINTSNHTTQPINIDGYKAALKKNNRVEGFFSSNDGIGLLDKLDKQYLKTRDFVNMYDKHIYGLRNAWIILSVITALLILGYLKFLINFPNTLIAFWIFTIVLMYIFSIIFLLSSEYYRRKINKIWKNYQIYGTL